MIQEYKTILDINENSFKEKNSEFITQIFHCQNYDLFLKIITDIKKKYYDARHHCYAYKFLDGTFKYSDDGEPSGTAGIKIFNAISHFDLTDVLVVVTRYFGGIKLGVGPLGKAYYNSAFECIEKSKIITKKAFIKIEIKTEISLVSTFYRLFSVHNAKILENNYSDKLLLKILVPLENIDMLKAQTTEATNGQCEFIKYDEYEYL